MSDEKSLSDYVQAYKQKAVDSKQGHSKHNAGTHDGVKGLSQEDRAKNRGKYLNEEQEEEEEEEPTEEQVLAMLKAKLASQAETIKCLQAICKGVKDQKGVVACGQVPIPVLGLGILSKDSKTQPEIKAHVSKSLEYPQFQSGYEEIPPNHGYQNQMSQEEIPQICQDDIEDPSLELGQGIYPRDLETQQENKALVSKTMQSGFEETPANPEYQNQMVPEQNVQLESIQFKAEDFGRNQFAPHDFQSESRQKPPEDYKSNGGFTDDQTAVENNDWKVSTELTQERKDCYQKAFERGFAAGFSKVFKDNM